MDVLHASSPKHLDTSAHGFRFTVTFFRFQKLPDFYLCNGYIILFLVQNRACGKKFDFHENKRVGRTHFMNDFARRLVLTQKLNPTRNGLY